MKVIFILLFLLNYIKCQDYPVDEDNDLEPLFQNIIPEQSGVSTKW